MIVMTHFKTVPCAIRTAIFALPLLLTITGAAYGFNVTANPWQEGKALFYVDFPTSNPPSGPSDTDFENAFIEAMNLWSQASAFRFELDTSRSADPCAMPGSNPENGVAFDLNNCGDGYGETTVAVEHAWFGSGIKIQTGITFDDSRTWDIYAGPATSGSVDFRRIAVHELGHSIGLLHETSVPAIMFPFAGNLEAPQTDDLNGVASLYDLDSDGIGIADDNCPDVANPSQSNKDGDTFGDSCDTDIDGDGVYNEETIDQELGTNNLSNSFFSLGASSGNGRLAQVFAVGITGQLTKIALPVGCSAGSNLVVEILDTNSGVPGTNVLSTFTISNPPVSSGQFQTYTLSSSLGVLEGDLLAIALDSSGSCTWRLPFNAVYDAGMAFFQPNSNWFSLSPDFSFQTFVFPAILDNCSFANNPGQANTDGFGDGDACTEENFLNPAQMPDFNFDGKSDIFYREYSSGINRTWTMDGTISSAKNNPGALSTTFDLVLLGDFNADGNTDVFARDTTTGFNRVWPMSGGLAVTKSNPGQWPSDFDIIKLGDFNGDGKADIFFRNSLSGAQRIWLMDGGTALSKNNPGSAFFQYDVVQLGDYNGDGKADIYYRDSVSGGQRIWIMDGGTAVSKNNPGNSLASYDMLKQGDYNGDGKTDIFYRSSFTGNNQIWLMDGGSAISKNNPGKWFSNYDIVKQGDFNNDGKTDIYFRDGTSGNNRIWLMDGGSAISKNGISRWPSSYDLVWHGDFNNDQKTDIYFRESATGRNRIWLMDGGTVTSKNNPGNWPSTFDRINLGDFNGDNKTDLFFRESTSGINRIWLMDGGFATLKGNPGAWVGSYDVIRTGP